jgi:hypothetical protein
MLIDFNDVLLLILILSRVTAMLCRTFGDAVTALPATTMWQSSLAVSRNSSIISVTILQHMILYTKWRQKHTHSRQHIRYFGLYYQSYFKSISANIELKVYSATCC